MTTSNLPVLYTIPKWNLKRGSGSNSIYYYIPMIDKWVNNKILYKTLSKLGINDQDYYDRWFLNITVPSDRPKCSAGCGRFRKYKSVGYGYTKYCYNPETGNPYHECLSLIGQEIQNRPEVKRKKLIAYSDPIVKSKMSAGGMKADHTSEEYRKKQSESVKLAKSTEEFKLKYAITNSLPEVKARRSAASRLAAPRISESNKIHFSTEEAKLNRSRVSKLIMSREDVRKRIGSSNSISVSKAWRDGKFDNRKGTGSGIRSTIEIHPGEFISFDSSYERSFYEYIDSLGLDIMRSIHRISYYITSEDSASYSRVGKFIKEGTHTYLPDFTIIRSSGIEELVEVKPEYLLDDPIVVVKRDAAVQYCKEHHIVHYTVTEKYLNSHKEEDKYYHVTEDDWI